MATAWGRTIVGFAEMGVCMENVHILKPTTKFTLAMLADRADPFMDAQKRESVLTGVLNAGRLLQI